MRMPREARRWWGRAHRYGAQWRAEHRIVAVGHGRQPQYSRKVRRMLTRLFR